MSDRLKVGIARALTSAARLNLTNADTFLRALRGVSESPTDARLRRLSAAENALECGLRASSALGEKIDKIDWQRLYISSSGISARDAMVAAFAIVSTSIFWGGNEWGCAHDAGLNGSQLLLSEWHGGVSQSRAFRTVGAVCATARLWAHEQRWLEVQALDIARLLPVEFTRLEFERVPATSITMRTLPVPGLMLPDSPPLRNGHHPQFRWITWRDTGKKYEFKPGREEDVIRILWNDWLSNGPGMKNAEIKTTIDHADTKGTFKVSRIFTQHPAWKDRVIRGRDGMKGVYWLWPRMHEERKQNED